MARKILRAGPNAHGIVRSRGRLNKRRLLAIVVTTIKHFITGLAVFL